MVSYGADGDSKQLRSMELSTGLFDKPSVNEKVVLTIRAGTNDEIYLRSFANKIFEYSKHSVLAFKLQVLQYLPASF